MTGRDAAQVADAHGDPPWATWGPRLADPARWQTTRVVELVARSVGRPFDEVAELLLAAPNRCRFILLRRLAVTRHSVVYASVDRRLAREVAVKIHHNANEHARRGAIIEARTNAELEHPNIVRIHDLGEHDHQLFSVSELCECDLQAWCIGADWHEILARIVEAGAGLSHLHAAGYVHGDIKPLNILINNSEAKLADFGNAGKRGASLRFGGTPGFVAPEVARGDRMPSGDVFALGVTAWACLFGTLPFGKLRGDARTAIATGVQRATDREIQPPRVIPKGMPGRVVGLLGRALDPDPAKRPSLDPWLAELRSISTDRPRRWLPGLFEKRESREARE